MLNIIGEKYGRLTVIKEIEKKSGKRRFLCQCGCGNYKEVNMSDLRCGKTKSCGCLQKEKVKERMLAKKDNYQPIFRKDLSGQRFTKLTVLSFDKEQTKMINENKIDNKRAIWKCKCDCGNICYVASSSLINGSTKSCGCLQKEKASINMKNNIQPIAAKLKIEDLTNKHFGKLTIISLNEDKSLKGNGSFWNCICDCGNRVIVRGDDLKRGHTQSCGCIGNSLGQILIKEILNQYNINYKQEFIFKDLQDKTYLRFDFAIFDKDNLKLLIEYDGRQHFDKNSLWYNEDAIKHDRMKDDYCKLHHIPLLRIPYTYKTKEEIQNILIKELNL